MRISLNWLRELVDITISPEDLAEKLTLAGFEVEDIEDRRTWAEGVVVGRVLSQEKHPNADKLSVCQVDIGQPEPSTIVCGAPNVAADLYVPVATVGTFLPQSGEEGLKIKPAKLRGVASNGMICSLAELGLARESEGIHAFDPAVQSLSVGQDVRPLLGLDDVILDLSSTANRADALSMVGIAREVAALTGAPFKLPDIPEVVTPGVGTLSVEVADAQACPAYGATHLDQVQIKPSPLWLKRYLESADIRPINNVVDITNYILLMWGQPLHAFDASALQRVVEGADLPLGVRFANAQERLTTLDGQTRSLSTQNLLITAGDRPVALAGVMGGEETEVQDGTKTIVLEAALFHSLTIRRSARAQGLRTEASARYERGANEALLEIACHHALTLLTELTGGTIIAQAIADHRRYTQRTIELRLERVNQILGPVEGAEEEIAELTAEDITPILEALGFVLTPQREGVWQVGVPPHRHHDIEREIDLIEEIARLYGYDRFCDSLPNKTEPGYLPVDDVIVRQIREALRGAGLTELLHYSWTKPEARADQISPAEGRQVAVINPLLIEFSALRTELLTGLLQAFQYNVEQGNGSLNGFEIGKVFWKEDGKILEAPALVGILSGKPMLGKWCHPQPLFLSWYEAKGMLERVFQALGLSVEYQPNRQDQRFHPGRTASLWLQGEPLGQFGQLHPQLRQERELPDDIYAFELDLNTLLDAIAERQESMITFQPFSTYPAAERDLAFFISTEVSVAELERTMRKAATIPNGTLLAGIELFDEYRGEHVPEGQRSLAFRMVYRASDHTLTDAEVNPIHQRIRDALEEKFQVSLRS
jgi:phenylalanyl-tRNA synthetase beta chain